MNIISISEARANLPKIISAIGGELDRVLISVKNRPKAVIISLEELESLEETIGILTTPGARASIIRGTKQAKRREGIPLPKI